MENMVLLLLCFGGGLAVVAAAYLFGDAHKSYSKEQALIDALRPKRDLWQVTTTTRYAKPRCGYCNGKLSAMTDRCTHCGAPR